MDGSSGIRLSATPSIRRGFSRDCPPIASRSPAAGKISASTATTATAVRHFKWLQSRTPRQACGRFAKSIKAPRTKSIPRRGLVTRAQSEEAEGYNFRGKGTGSLELVSVERRDSQWTKQLCQEADRYFQASRAYEEKTEQAVNDDKRSKQLMEEADAILEAAQSAASLPIIKEQLDQQLTSHKWMATNIAAEAGRRAKVVGHPAAAWELPDLNGKSHSLEEYRGKVVILDFWYRGCHPCMRAMPQVKQLAAEFQGQPVVVLGMSVDESDADARFVVDKMRVDYTTLKTDWELPQKYAAHACPLLVIIDQKGTVRDLHVGYSQSLQREVGEIVRQLLAKK
jgi:peroxiredoxin